MADINEVWRKFEAMLETTSAELLLDSLVQALDADTLDENLRFISRGLDIDYDEL